MLSDRDISVYFCKCQTANICRSTSFSMQNKIRKQKRWKPWRVYEYKGNYYTMTGIGTNGFIVLAYPFRKDDL